MAEPKEKVFVVNKNVNHDGEFYAKGKRIGPSDKGFQSLLDQGHAEEFKVPQAPVEPADQEPTESKQSGKKSK